MFLEYLNRYTENCRRSRVDLSYKTLNTFLHFYIGANHSVIMLAHIMYLNKIQKHRFSARIPHSGTLFRQAKQGRAAPAGVSPDEIEFRIVGQYPVTIYAYKFIIIPFKILHKRRVGVVLLESASQMEYSTQQGNGKE